MKVLILEDSASRIKVFKKNLKDHDLYFFDQVEEAKSAVDLLGPFDYYFLDHDLDGEIYVESSNENTGYQFAKFLKEKNIKAEFVIHSMNVVGVQNMKNELPTATVCSFSNLF